MSDIKNKEPIYQQSGVLPIRMRSEKELEILLITSRSGKRWIIPKGLVEDGMTPQESAAKEAYEEAGIYGVVGEKAVGRYYRRKWGGLCHIDVYLMHVRETKDTWPEDDRERKWLSITEAVSMVSEESLAELIACAPEHMEKVAWPA